MKAATKRQSNDLSHVHGLEKQAERQQELTARQDGHERDFEDPTSQACWGKSRAHEVDDELEAAASILAAKAKLDNLMLDRNRRTICGAQTYRASDIVEPSVA